MSPHTEQSLHQPASAATQTPSPHTFGLQSPHQTASFGLQTPSPQPMAQQSLHQPTSEGVHLPSPQLGQSLKQTPRSLSLQ
jgi:hypothetical protein